MPDPAHYHAIAALSALGPMRVWSLLVTVFGNLAQGDPLDGPTLSALMDQIGIKPEATRVALHRLRADGWITSQKQARFSQYSLTQKGQKDSMAARPRIYARPENTGGEATFVLMPSAKATLDPLDYIPVAPSLYICAQQTPVPERAMTLSARDLPKWLGSQIEPAHLARGYEALCKVLTQIEAECAVVSDATPQDTALLRVMIVHAWRRLALKHPILPRAAHSPDWRGHDCRALVTALLDRHPRPKVAQWGVR